MRSLAFALAALLALAGAPTPGHAQTTGEAAASKSKRTRSVKPAREPTVGQMAARDRMRKCGAEWREAKGKGATGGLKWPQYYSKCNARLKGGTA